MTGFERRGGWLCIGGHELRKVAVLAGGTPFYAYDRQMIADRVAELRRVLPERIGISYSIKANPMPAVVHHLAGLVDGFDVASGGELLLATDTGMRPEAICFSGPGKSVEEIAQAVAIGAVVNAESSGQIDVVARTGDQLGLTPAMMLRINPDFLPSRSGMRMGGGARPFGIDVEQIPSAMAVIRDSNVAFQGFHLFWGSQNLDAATVADAYSRSFDTIRAVSDALPVPPRRFCLGGGMGIPYTSGERPLDVSRVADALYGLQDSLDRHMPDCRLTIELGRYLVGEAGIYVCKILDKKRSHGEVFLITDGGLHHHLAACGQFGQAVRRSYPMELGNPTEEREIEIATVVGRLCTPIDRFGDQRPLPAMECGDYLIIFQSGAYGRSASPIGFLSHPAPRELLL